MHDEQEDVVRFGEKLMALLDESSFATTYKFALLLALIDCCMEADDPDSDVTTQIHPTELAKKVLGLYWTHTNPYGTKGVLRQSGTGQAEIVSLIKSYRSAPHLPPGCTLAEAALRDPDGLEGLVGRVEWKLVEMPLPRLQRIGTDSLNFIYEIDWTDGIRRSDYRKGVVDPWVRLRPGVANQLVRLAGIIRPLIQRMWMERVARYNDGVLGQPRLDEFLFGAERLATTRLYAALLELQDGRCFYSGQRLAAKGEIDHFLPWARYGNDTIENLVLASHQSNSGKSARLAAPDHLRDWFLRLEQQGAALAHVARDVRWASAPAATAAAARSIYLNMPDGIPLWRFGGTPVLSSRAALLAAMAH